MKIKTNELTGTALDWAVAICEGWKPVEVCNIAKVWLQRPNKRGDTDYEQVPPYSTKWSLGGLIIERECINIITGVYVSPMFWAAEMVKGGSQPRGLYDFNGNCGWVYLEDEIVTGPTPLVAAMRCYVESKLGSLVEVPEELL